MIRENKTYTIGCKCGASITTATFDEARKLGWHVEGTPLRLNCNYIDRCPECVEKERQRKYDSGDIWERISAGYYEDHPDKFNDDAIDFVGLKGHAKADKAMGKAYEDGHSGGYSEILNALIRYSDVIL
jgi:hypothetical protein